MKNYIIVLVLSLLFPAFALASAPVVQAFKFPKYGYRYYKLQEVMLPTIVDSTPMNPNCMRCYLQDGQYYHEGCVNP